MWVSLFGLNQNLTNIINQQLNRIFLTRLFAFHNYTSQVAKWAIELGPHGLKYVPRTATKSQDLVDFINDWAELQMPEENPNNTYWTIHFDGSKQLEGSGAGVILTSP